MNFKRGVLTVMICFGMISVSNAQSQKSNERKTPPSFAKLIKEMDANNDGKLAKEELKGPLKDDFDKVDTDEDGFISEAEFEKAPRPKGRKSRDKK